MSNWLKTILKMLPIETIAMFFIGQLRTLAKKSETQIDDFAVNALEEFLKTANIGADGVTVPPWMHELSSIFTLANIADFLTEQLAMLAKRTDNRLDDIAVKIFKQILIETGVIKQA